MEIEMSQIDPSMIISSINNQQQQDVVPSCNSTVSNANIVDEVIKASKRADRQRWQYLYVGCLPSLAVGCIIWIVWGVVQASSEQGENSPAAKKLYLTGIVMMSVTGFLLLVLTYKGYKSYSNGKKYAMLRVNVCHTVKLEGEQWIKFVNYIYGPDQTSLFSLGTIGACTFCCCQRPHYEKLIARGYGYIVFCERGFILDEMYRVVRNYTHHILGVKLLTGTGIRVYILRKDAQYMVKNYWSAERRQRAALSAFQQQKVELDIYLPPSLSEVFIIRLAIQIQSGLWHD